MLAAKPKVGHDWGRCHSFCRYLVIIWNVGRINIFRGSTRLWINLLGTRNVSRKPYDDPFECCCCDSLSLSIQESRCCHDWNNLTPTECNPTHTRWTGKSGNATKYAAWTFAMFMRDITPDNWTIKSSLTALWKLTRQSQSGVRHTLLHYLQVILSKTN